MTSGYLQGQEDGGRSDTHTFNICQCRFSVRLEIPAILEEEVMLLGRDSSSIGSPRIGNAELASNVVTALEAGEIEIIRKIVDTTDQHAEVTIDEYVTACYGTTEYPEDLTGVRLSLQGASGTESIEYAYRCRQSEMNGIVEAMAVVPQIDTRLGMRTNAGDASGYFREGFAFSPMFTLGIRKTFLGKSEFHTWLKLEKAS